MAGETFAQSLSGGRGLEAARYAAVLGALALPISIVELTGQANRLAIAGALTGGFLLAVASYVVVTRVVVARRLAKLHAIRGIDPAAADAVLDRRFRTAALTVRAKFVGDWGAIIKRARKLPRIVDARMEGDDLVVVTEYLRTRSNTIGIGSRTYYTNFEVYCCVIEIARLLPRCERFTIEVAGDA